MAELELEEGGLATTLLATARMLSAMVETYMVALRDSVVGVRVGIQVQCTKVLG